MPIRFLLFAAILVASVSPGAVVGCAQESSPDFSREIRPILSDHCFACHGPDEHERQADLRLDTAAGIATVIAAGKMDQSELIRRAISADPDQIMPPPEFNKPLSSDQIQLLQSWISGGGTVRGHWAFERPTQVPVPASAAHPIDHFIDTQAAQRGLSLNGIASDLALLRRLCLDLTGLPPTREQIERVRDGKLDYSRLVDELLASPAFGQHFGRFWLDLVRYADTHGLHLDNYREMWPYRDWVIDAFNQNMSFDQFVMEQLAGDLLPNATLSQQIASGFNRLNVTTNEGGSIYEEVFARNVIDRTDAFGTIFLGLTTQCAVCHDHKFDPISQREYYSLFAFFNSLDGQALDENKKDPAPVIPVPSREQTQQTIDFDSQIQQLRLEMLGPIEAVDDAQRQWESTLRANAELASKPIVVVPTSNDSDQELKPIAAPIQLGTLDSLGPFQVESSNPGIYRSFGSQQAAFDRDQTFPYEDKSFRWEPQPQWSPVEIHPLAAVDEGVTVYLIHQSIESPQAQTIELLLGTSDSHVVFLNSKSIAISDRQGPLEPLSETYKLDLISGHNDLYLKIVAIGSKPRFTYAYRSPAIEQPAGIIDLVKRTAAERSEEQAKSLRVYYRQVVCRHPDWTVLVDLLKGTVAAREKLQTEIATTLVWKELATPRQAKLLARGQYDQPGEVVVRAVPGFLPPMDETLSRDRLGLAKWLVSPQHPLTARVAVNRFWQSIFGIGLVRSSEDFGSQGAPPSHPELLDWLAVDFVQSGWDVKRLIKNLVTSRAYRRAARIDAENYQIDPTNRYLARGPRYRLDAEVLRDQALALAGLLNHDLGGPSVKPPQPAGLWYAVGYTRSNTANFHADPELEKQYRRSVYIFWKRTSAPPQMATFDAPSRESCTARRERTNTPLQALLLLNEIQYLQSAKHLAARMFAECQSQQPAVQMAWLLETVTARQPLDTEIDELVRLLDKMQTHYRGNPDQADELLAVDDTHLQAVDRTEHAAWMVIANTLLNLDEVVSR